MGITIAEFREITKDADPGDLMFIETANGASGICDAVVAEDAVILSSDDKGYFTFDDHATTNDQVQVLLNKSILVHTESSSFLFRPINMVLCVFHKPGNLIIHLDGIENPVHLDGVAAQALWNCITALPSHPALVSNSDGRK